MKTLQREVSVLRLDEWRYAICVDGVARYVGSHEECVRRAAILAPSDDHAAQDQALLRAICLMA